MEHMSADEWARGVLANAVDDPARIRSLFARAIDAVDGARSDVPKFPLGDLTYVMEPGEPGHFESEGRRVNSDGSPDDDAPDIPPALSADEWEKRYTQRPGIARVQIYEGQRGSLCIGHVKPDPIIVLPDVNDIAALIALANAAMTDEDPRKFTREHVTALRTMFNKTEMLDDSGPPEEGWKSTALSDARERIIDLADALESLLPPLTDPARD